jgi:N-acetylgalactosamine kinase
VSFIVAHCAVEANKYVSAGTGYNVRVVECKLAAALLAKKLGLQSDKVNILVDVQRESGATLAQCVEFVEKHLHQEAYTREELATALELSVRFRERVQPHRAHPLCSLISGLANSFSRESSI